MCLLHRSKGKTEIILTESHNAYSRLYGNGVNLTEKSVYKRNEVKLKSTGLRSLSLKIELTHIGCSLGHDVRKNGDYTLATKRKYGNDVVVVT